MERDEEELDNIFSPSRAFFAQTLFGVSSLVILGIVAWILK